MGRAADRYGSYREMLLDAFRNLDIPDPESLLIPESTPRALMAQEAAMAAQGLPLDPLAAMAKPGSVTRLLEHLDRKVPQSAPITRSLLVASQNQIDWARLQQTLHFAPSMLGELMATMATAATETHWVLPMYSNAISYSVTNMI